MKTYIIKRLLLMGVTLFGISLITFAIVQAAPGDPAQARAQQGGHGGGGKNQISKSIIEQTRKLYYLDKPILFNSDPDDRLSVQRRLIERLKSSDDEDRKSAHSDLLEIGTVALPALVADLGLAKRDVELQWLTDLLAQIVPEAAPKTDDLNARAAAWRAWWEAHKDDYTEERARELAASFLAGESSLQTLVDDGPGAWLAPHLIDPAKDPDSPLRDRAQAVLSQVLRKPWVMNDDPATRTGLEAKYAEAKTDEPRDAWIARTRERESRELAGRWESYWRDNQDRFLIYSSGERTVRMLSQTRFARWFGMLLRGDFGESYRTKRPVTEMILERLPISLQLSLISAFIAYAVAIPLGIHSAIRRGSRLDSALTVGLFLLYSLPTFFVAEMLIIFTTGGEYPLIFPTGHLASSNAADMPFGSAFLDHVWHLVLPITVLTYGSFAYISRQMRSGMLETIRQDYIRTAKAKGLSERSVIFKHALRNSLIPILTLLGSILPHLLSGSVIIEQIFSINGMGKLGFESVINRDYPVIMGISFFSATLTLVGIFLADLSYALVDPRISYD